MPSASFSIAAGWSPVGWNSEVSLKARAARFGASNGIVIADPV
jgi:hypothetical protein